MGEWAGEEVRALPLEALGERYRRYRLSSPQGEEEMARSLMRYGQLSPIVVWVCGGMAEVLDGFKRLSAARGLTGMKTLAARRIETDERGAKAAIYGLNQLGRQLAELEEAWIVFALVREDGLTQVEAASLLGRHKSWVHRRLALLERLCEAAKEDLRLGLVSVTAARQLVRLPAGNQPELMAVWRREQLSTTELGGTIDLWLASGTREKEEYILADPRRALRQAQGSCSLPRWDPRLSPAANRVSKHMGWLLHHLGWMENWLGYRGRNELTPCDGTILRPAFEKLAGQCQSVGELAGDLVRSLGVE